jgi:hypothetical protein
VTLRVAVALWACTQLASAAVHLPPTDLALAALASAFSLPLARQTLRRELTLVAHSVWHTWQTRVAPALMPPPGAQPPAALAAAWLAWRFSSGATRAFLAFLAVVKLSDVVGAWAMHLAHDGVMPADGAARTLTLEELDGEDH